MTTHYEKIQALGNRMASNLETMGVSASFSDGGLTLADKILQIQKFTSGLMLYGDKSIEQAGTTQSPNTITLSALLMENGKAKSGETVLLYESIYNKSSASGTLNLSIGSTWEIDLGSGTNIWLCADGASQQGGDYILSLSKSYIVGYGNGDYVISPTDITSDGKFKLKNNVLYFGNTSIDLSSYNFTLTNLNKITMSGSIKVYTATSLTTNDNGIATKSYTCSGVGLKEFYAESGTLVSVPFPVWDCIIYFKGDTVPSNTFPSITNVTVSSSDDWVNITNSGSATWQNILQNNSNNYLDPTKDYRVEFDFQISTTDYTVMGVCGGNVALSTVADTNPHSAIVELKNGIVSLYIDGSTTASSTGNVSSNTLISLRMVTNTLKLKNFKVYPI